MTDIALSDDLVHWRLGFKLSTMYIPRSFSSLIVISCTVFLESSILYSVLIWWPICITLHFSGWNRKSHVCDQDINLFRSSCRPKESSLVLIRHQILVSSANILMLLMIQVGNSHRYRFCDKQRSLSNFMLQVQYTGHCIGLLYKWIGCVDFPEHVKNGDKMLCIYDVIIWTAPKITASLHCIIYTHWWRVPLWLKQPP